jgi:hypothetical protein
LLLRLLHLLLSLIRPPGVLLFGISSITLVVLVEGDGDYTRLWLLLWLRLWLLLWLLLVFENRLRL